MRTRAFGIVVALLVTACTSEPGPPLAYQLGTGDGSPESVRLTVVVESRTEEDPSTREATDVAFHPNRIDELWVIERWPPDEDAYCYKSGLDDEEVIADCINYRGSVVVVPHGTEAGSAWTRVQDTNAWHFMRRPPQIAFGDTGNFATCGEARTGNYDDDAAHFIGPTLFSSDLSIFGVDPGEDLNGSHLDMLHASPFCVGIAHERDNVYWVFNGQAGSLDRYDFHTDHGIGMADHSDGEIWRYARAELKREPWVPGQMAYRHADGKLYVADTGNGRIVRLDPSTGHVAGQFEPNYDQVQTHEVIDGASLVEVVPPGMLEQPSGLVLSDDLLFVSDHATSKLYAFSFDGDLVRSLDTGLPAGSLTGLALGPDDKLYFADRLSGRAYRVDPR